MSKIQRKWIHESRIISILFFRVSELYEYALRPEHISSIGDETVFNTTITDTGALAVSSGQKTGRTPKEKRVVLDDLTRDVSTK